MAGWLLLVIGCVSACFPGHGKLVLHNICYPLCGVAVIFGIAGAASGRPMAGMLLIFTSIVVPIALTVLNITELF